MKPFSISILSAAALAAAACAPQVETKPALSELAPMVERLPVVGDTIVWDRNGTQVTRVVTSFDGKMQTIESSDGCAYTSGTGYAPSVSWSNCDPWSDGTQTVEPSGEIFPLAVGNTMSFKASGKNVDGDTWDTVRECSVKGTVNITVPAGTFDTYHVSCVDEWNVRDFYVAPELGQTVLYRQLRKSRNETILQKLISFEPGTNT